MVDQLRMALAVKLDELGIKRETINTVLNAFDQIATGYKIEKNNYLVTINNVADDIIKTFLVCKKMEGLADGTLNNYRLCVCNFFRQVKRLPDDITANDVRAYLFYYQKERGCSDRSLDKIRQYLHLFFGWANSEGYISRNPTLTIKTIKYETKPRKAMTQIELEYIRKAAETTKEKAIVEVLYSTGCRRAEMCGLKLGDVDLTAGTVHLFGKGKKHRTGYLNAKAVVALASWLKDRPHCDNDFVFVNDRKPYGGMSGATLAKIVARICDRASNSITKHVTPHVFRHTTATQALHSGMPITDIQKLLGHANVATTMIYAEVDQSTVQAEHLRFVV